jgi:predicted transglutaminase-like cysteine proteinase
MERYPAMNTAGRAKPPIGHVTFCERHPGECVRHGEQATMVLDNENWQQLLEVNHRVNRTVAPVTDLEHYKTEEFWTLPSNFGDCEDYVLLKRRTLIEQGWPTGALLITVVFDENNEGHAILIARTDRGEFVLDNKIPTIKVWYDTPYRYVKRQSEHDPMQWVSIDDRRRMDEGVASIR